MEEAVKIGAIVAEVFSFCAKEVGKSLLGQLANDAYKTFKSQLAERLGAKAVAAAEKRPAVLVAAVDSLDPAEQAWLKHLVVRLLAACDSDPGAQRAVGTEIKRLETAIAEVTNDHVASGSTGVRIDLLKADSVTIHSGSVGGRPLGKMNR